MSVLTDEEFGDLGYQGTPEDIERVLESDPSLVRRVVPGLNMTLLHAASSSDQGDVTARVRVLLKHGSDPNAKGHLGRTPLSFAVESSNPATPEVVKLLLDHGADPWIENDFGYDALDAAKLQQLDELQPVVELLERQAPRLKAP